GQRRNTLVDRRQLKIPGADPVGDACAIARVDIRDGTLLQITVGAVLQAAERAHADAIVVVRGPSHAGRGDVEHFRLAGEEERVRIKIPQIHAVPGAVAGTAPAAVVDEHHPAILAYIQTNAGFRSVEPALAVEIA